MCNRRAFLSIVLIAAAASVAHAGPARLTPGTSRSMPSVTRSAPAPALAWMQVIAFYQSVIGVGLLPVVIAPPAEILGVQDGPDGVDPLGIKGIAPKQKDEGDPAPTLP